MEAEIVKLDTDQRLVFGWASVTHDTNGHLLVDRQGDYIDDPAELEKAVYDYVLKSRDGGEIHLNRGVSTLVESMFFSPDKIEKLGIPAGTLPTGWWLGFKVHDDRVWDEVKKGNYKAFSVGGKGYRTPEVAKMTNTVSTDSTMGWTNNQVLTYPYPTGTITYQYPSPSAQEVAKQVVEMLKGQPDASDVHQGEKHGKGCQCKDCKRKRSMVAKTFEAKRELLELRKNNPYHDENGKFTTANNNRTGRGGGGGTAKPKKNPRAGTAQRVDMNDPKQRAAYERAKKREWAQEARDGSATRKPKRSNAGLKVKTVITHKGSGASHKLSRHDTGWETSQSKRFGTSYLRTALDNTFQVGATLNSADKVVGWRGAEYVSWSRRPRREKTFKTETEALDAVNGWVEDRAVNFGTKPKYAK